MHTLTEWAIQASWKMYQRRTKVEIAIVLIAFALGIVCLAFYTTFERRMMCWQLG